jgi:hypothetical protein
MIYRSSSLARAPVRRYLERLTKLDDLRARAEAVDMDWDDSEDEGCV